MKYVGKLELAGHIEAANPEQKTLAGTLVSYDEVGYAAVGGKIKVEAGAVELPKNVADVRLNLEHDRGRPIGRMMLASDTESGLSGVFHVVDTTNGRDAIAEAKAGLRDGFSIEADIVDSSYAEDGTLVIHKLSLTGVGLVTNPAIKSARVLEIAASESVEAGRYIPETATPKAEPVVVEEIPTEETAEVDTPIEEGEPVSETAPAVDAATAVIPTAPLMAAAAKPLPTPGEVFLAAMEGRIEATVDPSLLQEHPGLLPEPIIGPFIDTRVVDRPLVNATRRVSQPAEGSVYYRQKVTQHTTVGLQAEELDALSGQPLVVEKVLVEKHTAGGALKISVQDRDWTNPAALNNTISDLAGTMVIYTETAVASELVDTVDQTEVLATDADAAEWTLAVWNARAKVYAGCGQDANSLILSWDQYARLGALVDGQNRPLFPNVGAVNAPGVAEGGVAWGLNVIVSPYLESGTVIVGNMNFFEYAEDSVATMQLPNPSTLSVDMAIYRYYSMLITVKDAFCKLEPGL